MAINETALQELAVIADKLIELDPEATFNDLLLLYFKYKAGHDYSEILDIPPDDEEVIALHLSGFTPKKIAEILDDKPDYIKWLLLSYGLSPFHGNEKQSTLEKKQASEKAKWEELIKDGILT